MSSSSSPVPPDESPIQRQARLRRERREAKIKTGGSSRLEKITNVSGRAAEPELLSKAPNPPSVIASADLPAATDRALNPQPYLQDDDPAEVDISSLEYQQQQQQRGRRKPLPHAGAETGTGMSMEDDIRRLLRAGAGDRQAAGVGGGGGEEKEKDGIKQGGDQDPMMAMLSQIMGMPPPGQDPRSAGAGAGTGGLPPGMEALLGLGGGMGGGGGGGGGTPSQQAQQAATNAKQGVWIWKVVHVVVAMLLGVYLSLHTAFASSSQLQRSPAPSTSSQYFQTAGDTMYNQQQQQQQQQRNVFWIFATAELLLQGTRYFLEQGKDQEGSGGWLSMIGRVLPEPYRGYVRLMGRYSGIWATVVEDGMIVIWVLGVGRWFMGEIGI